MPVPFRPITRIKNMIDTLGKEITYAYDDLVFVSHNAYLLRMGDKGEMVDLFFNKESDTADRAAITMQIELAGRDQELVITRKGVFELIQSGEKDMTLTFSQECEIA